MKFKENLYKAGLSATIALLDVSSNLLATPKVEVKEETLTRQEVVNKILDIKLEMEKEWNNTNPDSKLIRNFIRGRIATCEDLLSKL